MPTGVLLLFCESQQSKVPVNFYVFSHKAICIWSSSVFFAEFQKYQLCQHLVRKKKLIFPHNEIHFIFYTMFRQFCHKTLHLLLVWLLNSHKNIKFFYFKSHMLNEAQLLFYEYLDTWHEHGGRSSQQYCLFFQKPNTKWIRCETMFFEWLTDRGNMHHALHCIFFFINVMSDFSET